MIPTAKLEINLKQISMDLKL